MPAALENKRILVGVTGGIAIYKTLGLLSMLNKAGASTEVIMTEGAKAFVTPMTFQTMSRHRVYDAIFSDEDGFIPHIDLSRRNDVLLIAPASADCLAKLAHGLADDLLSATALASTCPIIVSPAMNTVMFNHPATQTNLELLRARGVQIIPPDSGFLACNAFGDGRMPEAESLLRYLEAFFTVKDLAGKRIVVTGGATRERIDPVRFMTNDSSGKQGAALAERAALRGAEVTFIHGAVSTPLPRGAHCLAVESAAELLEATRRAFEEADALIMAAAPADYRPERSFDHKLKKEEGTAALTLNFVKNPDILKTVTRNKGNRTVIGFAAETDDALNNGRKKLADKKLDYIIVNDVTERGAGFNHDTNIVTIIGENRLERLPLMSKTDVADRVLDLLR